MHTQEKPPFSAHGTASRKQEPGAAPKQSVPYKGKTNKPRPAVQANQRGGSNSSINGYRKTEQEERHR